jgi:hypothetical protein
MKSIFGKYVLPFMQWLALLILIAIATDYFLHRYFSDYAGRYLGLVGVILLIISFIYSLRKRKLIENGSPKKLLLFHEYAAWFASVLILVHAGIHFNAILPWLSVIMMLIVVASGLVGKFLLKSASETLKSRKQEIINQGTSPEEADKKLFFDAITVDLMKKWRAVHLPVTLLFALLSLIHIATILMYAK